MKTLKAIPLMLAMLFFSLASCAYDFEVDGIYYNILSETDKTVEVTSGDVGYADHVHIPSTVGYNSVTYMVTSIGDWAFYGCSGLTSVFIPNSVTSIGNQAFYQCHGLTSVTIGNSVTSIGGIAFSGCISLTSLSVEPGNDVYDSRDGCNAIIESKSNELIAGCKSTIIPNSVTSIGSDALFRIEPLDYIFIPNSVTSKGSRAFCMSGLHFVSIPNSVTSIGSYAFEYCDLRSITIPNSVTSIGEYAFYYNLNLTTVTSLAKTAPTLEDGAFARLEGIGPNPVLYIPSGSEADYKAKGWYNYFIRVETFPSEEHISDGTLDEYVNESERGPIDIHYTRTLPNLAWNPLYVPFEIPCSALSGKYDVAYINSLHSYDYDDDGTIDNMTVEVVKIPSGTLKANYPYLIRARSDEDRSMHLVLEDATLYRTEENGIDCSSVYNLFEVKGTYSRKSSSELGGSLAISTSGAWQPIPEGSSLGPFRLYLTISSRGDSPLKIEPSALSRVNIVVSGEDDSATGIDGVEQGSASQTNPPKIYDLSGRRVHSPSRGGVYMVNGRKVVL